MVTASYLFVKGVIDNDLWNKCPEEGRKAHSPNAHRVKQKLKALHRLRDNPSAGTVKDRRCNDKIPSFKLNGDLHTNHPPEP